MFGLNQNFMGLLIVLSVLLLAVTLYVINQNCLEINRILSAHKNEMESQKKINDALRDKCRRLNDELYKSKK